MRKLKNKELNRKTAEQYKNSGKTPFIVILDNVRSLNNIGSIFRTCDAFLIETIYLCGITASPPHREIHKTALGATESVDWKYFESPDEAVESLRNNNYFIVSIEQTDNSVSLRDFKIEKEKKYALIFGNEVKGVNQSVIDKSDISVEIPQFGTKHSFNIAVSAGIVLWEIFAKYQELEI
jgi:tRNA G18 (ribose-2'-O)-methylase SpoU